MGHHGKNMCKILKYIYIYGKVKLKRTNSSPRGPPLLDLSGTSSRVCFHGILCAQPTR